MEFDSSGLDSMVFMETILQTSSQARSIRVDNRWVTKQSPKAWKRVELRESTKGKLLVDILHRQIYVWDGKESCARKWHLVVRREINSPEKISTAAVLG